MTDSFRNGSSFVHKLLSGENLMIRISWYSMALFCCLSVLVINGVPLFYFDTGGYLIQGDQFLKLLGLMHDQVIGLGSEAGKEVSNADGKIQGSRSLIYGILLSTFHNFAGLSGVAIAQSLILIGSIWIAARITLRSYAADISVAAATGLSVMAACLGAAPFYTAYLMPDVFAPVLILSLASISAFAGLMRRWEVITCLVLAVTATVMHPSHLLIAMIFVPVALFASMLTHSRRILLSFLLAGSVVLVGIAERLTFTIAAKTVGDSEVVYQPFLTARLIVDGPGSVYLENVCPNAQIATCKLFEALTRPEQITASHIVFEVSKELGSFRLLPVDTQRKIVQEQKSILAGIIRTHPMDLIRAIGRNTLAQLRYVSVKMTLPEESVLESLGDSVPSASKYFAQAKLTNWDRWEPKVSLFHYFLYSISALVILWMLFQPHEGLNRDIRVFALCILIGILANSLILGALSQPADRYGARVAFLLPVLAALMVLLRGYRRSGNISEPGSEEDRS